MTNLSRKLASFVRISFVIVVSILALQRSVHEQGDPIERVRAFTRPVEFNYVSWSIDALVLKLGQYGLGVTGYLQPQESQDAVRDYLELFRTIRNLENDIEVIYTDPNVVDAERTSAIFREELNDTYRTRDQLAPVAESILQRQLAFILEEFDFAIAGKPFPPVLYHVTPLPLALIVSPRDIIQQDADISLDPDLTLAQRAKMEEEVDTKLNVSSLIVNVGGVGLYPTMVMQSDNINWLAEVVAHEWIHNFLTLRPLGASYFSTPEVRTMNETAASIAGIELGEALISTFYPQFVPPPPPVDMGTPDEPVIESPPTTPVFDFRVEMHETRVTADELLAEGKIEEAEAYMEKRRLVFWENGYRIRKLNQAYFAFHGAYADLPGGAAGEDPVGPAVRALRADSQTLAEFLKRISWMWSFDQLLNAIEPGQ